MLPGHHPFLPTSREGICLRVNEFSIDMIIIFSGIQRSSLPLLHLTPFPGSPTWIRSQKCFACPTLTTNPGRDLVCSCSSGSYMGLANGHCCQYRGGSFGPQGFGIWTMKRESWACPPHLPTSVTFFLHSWLLLRSPAPNH